MRKIFRFFLWVAACGVLLFSAFQLTAYIRERSASTGLNERLTEEAVVVKETAVEKETIVLNETDDKQNSHEATPKQEADAEPTPADTIPVEVDFEVLRKTNADVVGWIFCKDTPVSLPLVQGKDNNYYLNRIFDGTWNSSGTLFLDYRNSGDFTDVNTIVYGHNMKDNRMFGTLPNYEEQSYFDEHPVMWILTPENDYKLELVAGYVTSAASDIYSFEQSEQNVFALVERSMELSTFTSGVQISQGDRFVTLSTCSEEYDNARYVLIGRLIPLRQKGEAGNAE